MKEKDLKPPSDYIRHNGINAVARKLSNNTLKRKYEDAASDDVSVKTRRTAEDVSLTQDACFFCDGKHGKLHKASTMGLDFKVRECAHDLQDRTLLAKLSVGDMVAADAVYHNACLANLYRRAQKLRETT